MISPDQLPLVAAHFGVFLKLKSHRSCSDVQMVLRNSACFGNTGRGVCESLTHTNLPMRAKTIEEQRQRECWENTNEGDSRAEQVGGTR